MTEQTNTQTQMAPRPASDASLAFLDRLVTEREITPELAAAWMSFKEEGILLSQGAVSRAIDELRNAPRRAGFDWRHRDALPSIVDEVRRYRIDAQARAETAEQIAAEDAAAADPLTAA